MFDPVLGHPVSDEEAGRRKRAALNPAPAEALPEAKVLPQPPAQVVNVEEQIRAIHQKFASEKK